MQFILSSLVFVSVILLIYTCVRYDLPYDHAVSQKQKQNTVLDANPSAVSHAGARGHVEVELEVTWGSS